MLEVWCEERVPRFPLPPSEPPPGSQAASLSARRHAGGRQGRPWRLGCKVGEKLFCSKKKRKA